MSLSASAAPAAIAPVVRRFGLRLGTSTTPLAVVAVAALFALCHPYEGLVGDSTVYVGRILADHDPAGLGRDLLFANDGQSGFSLFRCLASPLVLALGPSLAATFIAAAGSLCWLAGLIALAHGMARGRLAWAIVVIVAVLPAGYGDTGHFSFAETSAVPRPFAEAAVMAALAAILAGRWRLAVASLAVAVTMHPIMAAPGVAVAVLLGLWRLSPARRRIALAGLGACAAAGLLAALAGVPLLERMVRVVDPDWFGMIIGRGPHLFPTRWAASALSPLLAAGATIAIAARLVAPPRRRLLVAVLGVGAASLVASVLLSDSLHLLLFVQLQMWRATWLVGVLGGCALAICMAALWSRDDAGRLVLALLAVAWLVQPTPLVTAAVAGAALLLEFGSIRRLLTLNGRTVAWVCGLAGLAILYWAAGGILGYVAFLRALPPGDAPRLVDPIRNALQTVPLVLLVMLWLHGPSLAPRWRLPRLALGAIGLGASALGLWDQRTAAARALETPPADFAALVADRPGAVLWLDGMSEAWFSLRRPQYMSPQQAVSIVFSRPLAMEWRRRAQRLADLGLARRSTLRPFTNAADDDRLRVTSDAVAGLCRQPDAPGTIVMPIGQGASPPGDVGAVVWTLPSPMFAYEGHASTQEWHRIEAFAAIPCRGVPH